MFGIGRDRKYDVVITLNKDGSKKKIVKKVQKRKYDIQKIDGLDEKKLLLQKKCMKELKKKIN